MGDPTTWTCPDCGAENSLDPSVVTLTVEVWKSCDECGERFSLNTRGKEA